jgi:hypothetical protein
MGRTTRPGTSITDFQPDDTDTKMYLNSTIHYHLQQLLEMIKEKWPAADLDKIVIGAEHIHTECLGYDRYDPGDYTNFILIENKS